MAKANEIPDINGAEAFGSAAVRVVAIRAQELFDHSEGVLDVDDIERVHDMRVATRRLRAVLEIFAPCFDPELHREVLRQVKRLADALGERRDPDVHIDALKRYADAVPAEDRPGIGALIATFRAEQDEANERLALALEELERNDLRGRLDALISSAPAAGARDPQP
jgi:CHAD domain-containing protein